MRLDYTSSSDTDVAIVFCRWRNIDIWFSRTISERINGVGQSVIYRKLPATLNKKTNKQATLINTPDNLNISDVLILTNLIIISTNQ